MCPTITGYRDITQIERYVLQYGEPYRRLLEDAVPFFEVFQKKHGISLDMDATVADLVEKARVPVVPENTSPAN